MASDSDVEAYLNQLSRKTHHLKQDGQPWEDSVSSPSGGDHPPSDLSVSSNLSLHAESREPKTYSHRKTPGGGGGHLSDITALSEKYSHSKGEKTANKDKFSTLEEKYLKKYNINASTNKSDELLKETKHRKNLAEKNGVRDRPGTKNQEPKERKTQANAVYSSEEIDDENLAHYLRQVSLTSEEYSGNKDTNDTDNKTDDSIDDVLNLKNIIDADILGEEENSNRSSHLSPADQSIESINDGAGRSKSQPFTKHAAKSPSNAVQVTKEEKTEASRAKNILSPSKSSLFYSNRQKKDDEEETEEEHHPPVRLLLSQAGSNLFHSSRRKSSIVFNEIHEGKVKPKPSKETHKIKAKARHKSASESTIDTASESHISEQVLGSESIDDLASRSVASEGTQEQVEEDSRVSSSASTVKSEGREGSKQDSSTSSQTKHSIDSASPRKSEKKYNKSPSTKDHKSDDRRKSHKESNSHHHKGRKEHKTSHRKRKETERSKRRSKKKHRSPSSSSLSSSSSSSSSESEPSYSMSKSARHRSRSHKKSNRRSTHCHWSEPPYLRHSGWSCCCLHAGYAASAQTLPTFTGGMSSVLSGSGLGVEEVMQQQVALVRQFMDSQQVMSHAYTSTLISSYRYTSLRRTEKYMKKRKPPLTFPEAYRLVKEEMEASER